MGKASVAILMTMYNAKGKIVDFLNSCYTRLDAMKTDDKFDFTLYLVDDSSDDNSAETVRQNFPQVILIQDDRKLYHNRGMRLAWSVAAKEDYDFYLWIDTNLNLKDDAIATLMETSGYLGHKAIVVGSVSDTSGTLRLGGRTKSGRLLNPDSILPLPCFTMNGNLILVPRYVYKIVGNLDEHYTQHYGDMDYAVRARKLGLTCVVAPGILAEKQINAGLPVWRNPSYSLRERVRFFRSPMGCPSKEHLRYDVRSLGLIQALIRYFSRLLMLVFVYGKK